VYWNDSKNAKWTTQASVWPKVCKTKESYMPAPTAAPTSQYAKITEGLCSDPITTAAQCKVAADDISDLTWTGTSSFHGISWPPAGCVVVNKVQVKWNSSPNSKMTTLASVWPKLCLSQSSYTPVTK
jgi:hypothetical protein